MTSDFEASYAYCLVENANHDPDKGNLRPIFVGDDLTPVDSAFDEFPNNGMIWVSKGFDRCSRLGRGEFVRAKVAFVNTNWEHVQPGDQRISKFSTYEKLIDSIPAFTINSVAVGEYPDPADPSTFFAMTLGRPPASTVFIETVDPVGKRVILGPFEPIEKSFDSSADGTRFEYQPIERPVKGLWTPMMASSAVAFSFDFDLIPNTCFRVQEDADYLVETDNLPFASAELVDLCSNEALVRWASKEIRQKTSKKAVVSDLHRELKAISSTVVLPEAVLRSRLMRLEQISSHDEEENKNRSSEIDPETFLKSEEGRKAIEQYVHTHKEEMIFDFLGKERESIEEDVKTLGNIKDALQKEEGELRKRIDALKKELEAEQTKALTEEKEVLTAQVNEMRESLKLLISVEELRGYRAGLEADVQVKMEQHSKAVSLLEQTQSDIRKTDETHKRRLLELKTDLDVLSGNVLEESEVGIFDIDAEFESFEYENDVHLLRSQILHYVHEYMSDQDYLIEKEVLLGLLVAMTQNLICTISGPPGSGKSSLISSLSKALGLRTNKNFVRVQVQRGWTTSHELLGFKNRLSNAYEPDSFGVHRLIKQMHLSPDNDWMGLVMLDEANLSPLEHYWANFMGATDNPASFICEPAIHGLPPRLRFVTTINNDSTTEPLSPRFVDRSPVIKLTGDDKSVPLFTASDEKAPVRSKQLAYHHLAAAFLDKYPDELTNNENEVLQALLSMQQTGLYKISNRSMLAVYKFVSVSRELFRELSGSRLTALDYATAIHLLPSLGGQGRSYRKNLEELQSLLKEHQLSYSEALVAEVISNSEYDAYSFFS